ncbi:MAG TPA: tetratricopeptide repeat protein [Acidobacteriaceae bacterium]|nr:tetratricopeptide repeat protein [Acidobacteriaceae bacterium]
MLKAQAVHYARLNTPQSMNMTLQWRLIFARCMLALVIAGASGLEALASTQAAQPTQTFSQIDELGLPPATASQLKRALEGHDYVAAEKVLMAEIGRDPHSPEAARLLQFLGGVYFLDHDAWGAAVAWNKAKAIAPLPPTLNFSLAMAYIRLGHSDWARKELEALGREDSKNALYPYWLGRLDYDADQYDHAILQFQKAIQLAPDMAPAYNNLGLCYYRQNRNRLAVANYQKAIDLNQKAGHPDAWPYLNLAITERSLSEASEAEMHLREAIRLDPKLAVAHFQLGNILENKGQTKDAMDQFHAAASVDPGYAEPHYALARIYRKLGDMTDARNEMKSYLRIHSHPQPPALPSSVPSQR